MAVDTVNKRFSMLSMARPFVPTLPTPDSSFDAGNRQQLAWMYAALDTGGAVFVTARYTIEGDPRLTVIVGDPRDTRIEADERNTAIVADARNTIITADPRDTIIIG